MGKLLTMLRRGKTRTTALVAIVTAAIIVPATLYAWGPTRPTYTIERPADHVTFNSITNNPNIGDERNFVGIREATAPNVWHDEIQVERGKEYVVRMYVHNNAAANLNKIAENTTARFTLPTATGRSVQVDGSITASNASPQMVYDHATFKGAEDFNVAYVPGSLKFENNVFGPNGTALPETIFDQRGALLGYDKLDGKIPGCFEYDGYVSFKVKPQFAEKTNFTVSKKVSKHGANSWVENYNAQPGEKVDYLIQYKNTGTAQQDNVVIKDKLPANMQYVAGSTKFGTREKPDGQQASDNITTSGINIGSYAPNAGTWAMFSATVPAKDKLECGNNTLKNVARVEIDEGYKEDDANVTVPKECQPQAEYKCTALAVSKLSDNKFKFETGYSVTNGTFKSVSYTIRNEAGATIATVNGTPNVAEYTQATPGKYTVQATVTFTVNGQDVTATSEACKKAFEVPAPEDKKIIVCEIATKKIVTIKESEFDASKYSKNLDDCKEVPTDIIVCDLTTKQVVTIKESEFDSSKYSKNLDDCKETPVTPEEYCPIPGKEHMPKNSPDCIVTPTELPQTGSNDGILTIAGLATLALALGYAVTARRTIG